MALQYSFTTAFSFAFLILCFAFSVKPCLSHVIPKGSNAHNSNNSVASINHSIFYNNVDVSELYDITNWNPAYDSFNSQSGSIRVDGHRVKQRKVIDACRPYQRNI